MLYPPPLFTWRSDSNQNVIRCVERSAVYIFRCSLTFPIPVNHLTTFSQKGWERKRQENLVKFYSKTK